MYAVIKHQGFVCRKLFGREEQRQRYDATNRGVPSKSAGDVKLFSRVAALGIAHVHCAEARRHHFQFLCNFFS
jgi:hypothetical protein